MDNEATFVFKPVTREGSHLLITMVGMSGDGKTLSAILMMRGLVGEKGKFAFLDTETGRGKIYSGRAGGFDYAELAPPFSPDRYITAIKDAHRQGFNGIVIDSGSHEWEGVGGLLEMADAQRTSSGREMTGLLKWAKPKAAHKRFVQTILTTPMHIIICLRAKEKLVQEKVKQANGQMKDEIVSKGFVPIQDKMFKYEMTLQLFMQSREVNGQSIGGFAKLDKCPDELLFAFKDGEQVGIETGKRLAQWVATGTPIDTEFVNLKQEAHAAASHGVDAYANWWKNAGGVKQNRLKDHHKDLKSVAEAADQEKEMQQQEEPDEVIGDSLPSSYEEYSNDDGI